MPSLALRALLLPASLSLLVAATPAPTPRPNANVVEERAPLVTPSLVDYSPSKPWQGKRDIVSSVEGDVNSLLSGLGSGIPSFFASGVVPWFQGLPTGSAVQSSLGLPDSSLSALPTQVLNVPPYANWTDKGWNVRFHGNVYKQPNVSNDTLDNLSNKLFIYGTSVKDLTPDEQAETRNVTAEIFVVQQGNVNVSTIHLSPLSNQNDNATTPSGGTQDIALPFPTTEQGDFDVFMPINSAGLQPGNSTQEIQRLNTYVEGATLGNATAWLVPNEGLTMVSDIDDILRVTKIWSPEQGLLSSFARPYTQWEDMTAIYANLSQSLPNLHFHYLTTLPEQVTRNYMSFIYADYPLGSFDTRPLNFSDVSETLSIRKFLLDKLFQTFPQRKFILIADTSNSDVMKDYPAMATQYPGQVQCIWLRNTSATDPTDKFPYDTSGFKGLNQVIPLLNSQFSRPVANGYRVCTCSSSTPTT